MKVNEIFESISGEAGPMIPQGHWTTFIRLQGCNLKCQYCDTPISQEIYGGFQMDINVILESCHSKNVIITGGEPFNQPGISDLIEALWKSNHIIQVETNGSILDIPTTASRLGYSMDIKCPCSGGMENYMVSPSRLMAAPFWGLVPVYLKFVIQNEIDVEFALPYMARAAFRHSTKIVLSPIHAGPKSGEIIKMALRMITKCNRPLLDHLVVSPQIHKILKMK